MSFDIVKTFRQRLGENYKLHTKYVNPAWATVTQLIGYDKVYAKAEGCYLWDQDGKRYLDCVSGFCVSNIGHNHPVVRQALRDALNESLPNLIQLDCSLLSGLLAEALIERIPWLEMVFFANSGAEAIEAAMKFARCATGRQRILTPTRSYHGVTYGALSVTGNAMWRDGFRAALSPRRTRYHSATVTRLSGSSLQGTSPASCWNLFRPARASSPRLTGTLRAWSRCAESTRRSSSWTRSIRVSGRTGTFLASEQWNIKPDIICLSKGLSGAMVPVSAVVTRKPIIQGASRVLTAAASTPRHSWANNWQ